MTRHFISLQPVRRAAPGRPFLLALAVLVAAVPVAARDGAGDALRGRVLDAATRHPIAGAEVACPDQTLVSTDERGEFACPAAVRAPFSLVVVAAGFLPRALEVADLRQQDRLEVRLERAPQYAEQVVVRSPAPAPPEPVQDVTARTVAATPGALEDGLQSLRALPGVVARHGWSGRLYVRGGRPDQNGIYLDGIPVYDPYRLFGLVSLFNPEMLESISLHPGGFDVRYGDRLSAVIAGENRVGALDTALAGSASLSLTNTNLRAEGRLGLGFPSSWLVSFRRTYFDLVARDADIPSFTDLQGRILLEPSPRHRLTLTVMGSVEKTDASLDEEEFSGVPESRIEAGDNQKNTVLGLRGQHTFDDRLRLHYVLSRTRDQQDSDTYYREGETGYETRFDQDLDAVTSSVRTWLEATWDRHTLELGGEAARSENEVSFHLDSQDPRIVIPDSIKNFATEQSYNKYGAFLQDTIALSRTLDLKAGVRWDRSELSGMSTTSPRASLVWRPRSAWELRAAWGHYYQYPSFEALQGDGYFLDLRGIKEARLEPEHAEHFLAGAAYTSPQGWKLAVDLYNKPLSNILASGREEETVLILDADNQAVPYTRRELTYLPENSRRGYARGGQVVFTLLEGTGRPYYGMLAYTYGEARTRDDAVWRWEDHDQRHSLLLVAGCKLGRRLELSGKWLLATGFPYTPLGKLIRVVNDVNGDGIYDPAAGDTFTWQRDDPDARINAGRLPPCHRLDLRLEYTPPAGRLAWSYYVDIINAYGRTNVEGWRYTADYSRREPEEGLPFLPSVGVKLRF
ncbi:MAG TPA: TonB-dependent receptor [Thermoanaerobaculaceae bacterium]|nr:TonB-dependent receptor [Thermoanaerobaculaceae bacterium]HRS16573.1 TonB-dependent receptor [Thermoanaerobaculaceae bacterium]